MLELCDDFVMFRLTSAICDLCDNFVVFWILIMACSMLGPSGGFTVFWLSIVAEAVLGRSGDFTSKSVRNGFLHEFPLCLWI